MDFKGQVGIVTGGTRGIGKAVAESLAQKGVNLVVAARTLASAHEVAASLSQQGVTAIGIWKSVHLVQGCFGLNYPRR